MALNGRRQNRKVRAAQDQRIGRIGGREERFEIVLDRGRRRTRIRPAFLGERDEDLAG